MPIDDRLKIYNEFKNYKYRILVSTDLFGRGIDIEKINVVINYNMPTESD
jgi:ATP-dependent RNA helicase UAP56/SUB2